MFLDLKHYGKINVSGSNEPGPSSSGKGGERVGTETRGSALWKADLKGSQEATKRLLAWKVIFGGSLPGLVSSAASAKTELRHHLPLPPHHPWAFQVCFCSQGQDQDLVGELALQ